MENKNERISMEEALEKMDQNKENIEKSAERISKAILKELESNDYSSLDIVVVMEMVNRAVMNQKEIKETQKLAKKLLDETKFDINLEKEIEELDYIG